MKRVAFLIVLIFIAIVILEEISKRKRQNKYLMMQNTGEQNLEEDVWLGS
jgi:hypothetical protein